MDHEEGLYEGKIIMNSSQKELFDRLAKEKALQKRLFIGLAKVKKDDTDNCHEF
jgi:hypothetical protein